ncbi:MAG: hypothetical protein H0W97_05395 [Actinobacteria bacterium]|nr:hypothetical protein [Actinomycetota bacterium]
MTPGLARVGRGDRGRDRVRARTRGPRVEFQGSSLYEFTDDLLQTYSQSGVHRVDDHTLGLRDAVLVFEVIDEAPEHLTGTSSRCSIGEVSTSASPDLPTPT